MTDPVHTTEPFRVALEAAPTGMIMVDSEGRIVLVNSRVEKLLGYSREEVIGQPIERLLPAHPPPHARRKDGTEVPVEIERNPIETAGGRFVLSSVADVSERKRSEREHERLLRQLQRLNSELEQRVLARTSELTAALREREVLLQEVQHRVKNNLQVISSLINTQLRMLRDGAGRSALVECQKRVQAIALIHSQLYQSRDYARVPFSEYARSLAANVFEATDVSPHAVALELAIEDVALAVDKAIPCGLILNELITNALKHGFPGGRSGTIRVELVRTPGVGLRLSVSDDGVGLPPGIDVHATGSLGLHLVRMLAKQLDAALETAGGAGTPGTRFRLSIPEEPS